MSVLYVILHTHITCMYVSITTYYFWYFLHYIRFTFFMNISDFRKLVSPTITIPVYCFRFHLKSVIISRNWFTTTEKKRVCLLLSEIVNYCHEWILFWCIFDSRSTISDVRDFVIFTVLQFWEIMQMIVDVSFNGLSIPAYNFSIFFTFFSRKLENDPQLMPLNIFNKQSLLKSESQQGFSIRLVSI